VHFGHELAHSEEFFLGWYSKKIVFHVSKLTVLFTE
jgi:hypothetical protein